MQQDTVENVRPKAASVRNQFELLEKVMKEPRSITIRQREALLSALVSQGSFAALELPEDGIVGMSLNTHKAIANAELQDKGQYSALNDYRKAALNKLVLLSKENERPNRGTLDWYKSELAEKNAKLKGIADDILMMSQKLDEVLSLAHEMAQEAGKEAKFLKLRSEIIRKFPLKAQPDE